MNTLTGLLSSRARAEVFRLLFGVDPTQLHLREIARRAGLNEATVRQEMRHLAGAGLVLSRKDGNRTYYSANLVHPLFPEIRGLVRKTCGPAEVLRAALGTEGIRAAFVFGSMAGGAVRPESDVDLMVIGSATLRDLSARLDGVTERLGREVNPHTFTPREFANRVHSGDHFVTSVVASPREFVIGDEHELAAVGRQQVAAPAQDQPKRNRRVAIPGRPRSVRRR